MNLEKSSAQGKELSAQSLKYVNNSLAPGKFEWNFRHVIFKQILVIDDWGICCEIALTWKPQDLTDDKLTLVQVVAWCHQATSHCLNQCWPRSLPPYGVTRPQWVNAGKVLSPGHLHQIWAALRSCWPEVTILSSQAIRGIATGCLHRFLDKG